MHNIIKRFREPEEISVRMGQGQRPLLDNRGLQALRTTSLIGMNLSLTLLMGPGILPETTVGKHNLPCHLQMPTKSLLCKKEAICEHGPEAPLCPWAKAHLKRTVSKWKSVLWSDESKFDILVENHGCRVLQAKEEGDLPACYQRSVQKPASLMVWGCISVYGMGSLDVSEGTMNAERHVNVLEQHMLPSR